MELEIGLRAGEVVLDYRILRPSLVQWNRAWKARGKWTERELGKLAASWPQVSETMSRTFWVLAALLLSEAVPDPTPFPSTAMPVAPSEKWPLASTASIKSCLPPQAQPLWRSILWPSFTKSSRMPVIPALLGSLCNKPFSAAPVKRVAPTDVREKSRLNSNQGPVH